MSHETRMIVLWSTKFAGWQTASGTYSSEVKLARRYDEAGALAMMRKHWDPDTGCVLLPVDPRLMEKVDA